MTRERYLSLLEELDRSVHEMGDLVLKTIADSVEALESRNVSQAQDLIEGDTRIDTKRHQIEEQAFLLIATQQPAASDLRFIMACSIVATELERIGDYCAGIAKLTLTMAQEPVATPPHDINAMSSITRDLLSQALTAFKNRDVEAAASVWARDDEVDHLYEATFRRQIDEMVADRKKIRSGTYMLWVAHNIERMADRVTNIAEDVAFVATGDVRSFRENIQAQSIPT